MAPFLGRLYAPDPRDAQYSLRAITPASTRGWRYWWPSGYWGDQGPTSQCVAYAWLHFAEDGPLTHTGKVPVLEPDYVYREAQKIDEWPGEEPSYFGTSVRAGAKILQRHGYIREYRWAWDLQTVIDVLLERGPVVVGTNWYMDMFVPSAEGFVSVGGGFAGGHAYVLNGINRAKGVVRCKNSWSRSWGKQGFFWMSFETLELLLKENGDACLAVGQRPTES